MGDPIARAEEYVKKAEKKLSCLGILCPKSDDVADLLDRIVTSINLTKTCFFGSQYEDAVNLLYEAADSFELVQSWDKAGSTYVKLANFHMKLGSKHAAAQAYVDAARCYKKTNAKEAISCLEQAVNMFVDIGKLIKVGSCYEETAELYESEQNIDQAIVFLEKAADMFLYEDVPTCANQCKQKVAQYAAELGQYQKATEIYEDIAKQSLNNKLLMYGVKGHLLNAGICQLCKGDVVAFTNALERYQDIDPTFVQTHEYKLLVGIAGSIDVGDVAKFTAVVEEFHSMTPLTTLLLRVKPKELDEDDLT